jgi:putative peptidoglycan lipid II flippase
MKGTVQVGLGWWDAWQKRSVNTSIFAAMITVGGLTVLVKLTGMAKEMVVARQFGTSDALDAFLIALLLPQIAISLVGGSMNTALIPTYIQVREHEGERAAHRVFSSVMVVSSGFLVALSVILALSAPVVFPALASGFTPEKMALASSLYYLLLTMLVLSGVATSWGAVLNAGNRFALAAVVPMATSIVTLLLVLSVADQWGIHALALGSIGGALIETVFLGWGLWREGVPLLPKWCHIGPAVKQVLGQYSPAVAGSFIVAGTSVVSQSMAAMLSPGSVSALAYGSKVTNLVLGVGAMAVSTAVLPHFSRMVTMRDWGGLRHTLMTYVRLLLIVTFPLTLVLVYFSEPIVALMFQRGAFTEADTLVVSRVQVMYLLQVPAYVLIMLLVRLVSAFKANHLLIWSALISLSGMIIFTYLFMQWFELVGIALATSMSYLLSCVFLAVACVRIMKRKALSGEFS